MLHLTTVVMQLVDGDPKGVRLCRVEGESLVTIVVPRGMLHQANNLPGLPRRGIYFFMNETHGQVFHASAGQLTRGISSLHSSASTVESWNMLVVFLDSELNLDRDVLDALEERAEKLAQASDKKVTKAEGVEDYISPYKEETVERTWEQMLLRLEMLSFDFEADHKTLFSTSDCMKAPDDAVTTSSGRNRESSVSTKASDLSHESRKVTTAHPDVSQAREDSRGDKPVTYTQPASPESGYRPVSGSAGQKKESKDWAPAADVSHAQRFSDATSSTREGSHRRAGTKTERTGESRLYQCQSPTGAFAQARYDDRNDWVTVLKGAKVDLSNPVINSTEVAQQRRRIFGSKTGIQELSRDLVFRTPSAAATFVLGGVQSGWDEWKDSAGRTLGETSETYYF